MINLKYLTQHWNKEFDGILFFSQKIQEMLFYYSDDIVLTPVNNSRTLIDEFIHNEIKVRKGEVNSANLDYIIEELTHSIQHDKILIEKFGEEFINTMADNLKKERTAAVKYLKNKMLNNLYYKWCVEYLKKHSLLHNHKIEIEFASRVWIVEIISNGYAPEYVYNYIQSLMKKPIKDPRQFLFDFLDSFTFSNKKFRVYLIFTPLGLRYKDLFKNRMEITFDDNGEFNSIKVPKNCFVGYTDINSFDAYSAVYKASKRVNIFIKYFRALSNERSEVIKSQAFVQCENNYFFEKIPIKSWGFRTFRVDPKRNLSQFIDTVVLNCQIKPNQTQEQLNKILELHNEALTQQDLNDSFLNLWSIFEVVTSHIESESKIGKVQKGIVPVLSKDYFSVVLGNIDKDLKDNLSAEDYNFLTKQTNKEGIQSYLARFIFLPEFEALRNSYFEKLSDYPNIRMKIYKLYKLKDCKKDLFALTLKYEKRVSWHIYRLYRARNAIVHSGESHSRIQSLGEHLHIYADQIINEILMKLATEKTLETISDVLLDTRILLDKKKKIFLNDANLIEEDFNILLESYLYKK